MAWFFTSARPKDQDKKLEAIISTFSTPTQASFAKLKTLIDKNLPVEAFTKELLALQANAQRAGFSKQELDLQKGIISVANYSNLYWSQLMDKNDGVARTEIYYGSSPLLSDAVGYVAGVRQIKNAYADDIAAGADLSCYARANGVFNSSTFSAYATTHAIQISRPNDCGF